MNYTESQLAVIVASAFAAAKDAGYKYLEKHPGFDCCGFAWVTVRPGNSKLARYLKKLGHTSGGNGGIMVWDPAP